jgi:hypothetical protein
LHFVGQLLAYIHEARTLGQLNYVLSVYKFDIINIYLVYLLTAVGLTPGGSSSVHIYTQTIHRTTQNKQYIEQQKNLGRVYLVYKLN